MRWIFWFTEFLLNYKVTKHRTILITLAIFQGAIMILLNVFQKCKEATDNTGLGEVLF